jgi:ABC-type glycerol-3-phosphate transport system substrate-binding protein
VTGAAFNWYCLLNDSKARDQALAFVRYMAGPEVVARLYGNAASFPFMTAAQESFLRDLPQLNKDVALEGLPLVRPQVNPPRDPDIQAVIGKEVGPAFEGQRPVKDALAAAAQQIRPLLK